MNRREVKAALNVLGWDIVVQPLERATGWEVVCAHRTRRITNTDHNLVPLTFTAYGTTETGAIKHALERAKAAIHTTERAVIEEAPADA